MQLEDVEILLFLHTNEVSWKHVIAIKSLTGFNNNIISNWLNLSVRTFRQNRKSQRMLRENVKEHVIFLLVLIKHGIQVFGSSKAFDKWLDSENFYLGNDKPLRFLNTITGIKFIDNQLTAMEYGDNV